MLHLWVTCETQNQRQPVYGVYVDHTRLLPCRGCARNKVKSLTAVPSLIFFSWTHLLRIDGLPAHHFWDSFLEKLSSKSDKGASQTQKSHFQCHSHADKCLIESIDRVPPNTLTARTQPNSTHSKTMRQ